MNFCQSCKYVSALNKQCRRHPPVAHVVGFNPERNQPLIVSVFPSIRPEEDGCGDFVLDTDLLSGD